MAKCDICNKGVTFGIQVSHSHRRSNRTWKPNVRRVKAMVDGTPRHINVCTRCLRSGKVTATARHEIRRRHHLLFQSCQRSILEKILCYVVLSGPVSEKGRQKGRSPFRDHGLILFLIYILGVEGLSDYVLFPLCLGETRNSVLFHLLFSEKM